MALQVREKERKCVHVLPSLVAHAVGYETVIGAHNTVHVQMHMVGSTMIAWYGKCRRLQYCLGSDTPGKVAYCLSGMAWWHRPVGAQGMVGYGPRYCGLT